MGWQQQAAAVLRRAMNLAVQYQTAFEATENDLDKGGVVTVGELSGAADHKPLVLESSMW